VSQHRTCASCGKPGALPPHWVPGHGVKVRIDQWLCGKCVTLRVTRILRERRAHLQKTKQQIGDLQQW
jgi:hypothetical protein